MTNVVACIGLYSIALMTNVVARIGLYSIALMTNVFTRIGLYRGSINDKCCCTYRVV